MQNQSLYLFICLIYCWRCIVESTHHRKLGFFSKITTIDVFSKKKKKKELLHLWNQRKVHMSLRPWKRCSWAVFLGETMTSVMCLRSLNSGVPSCGYQLHMLGQLKRYTLCAHFFWDLKKEKNEEWVKGMNEINF